MKCYLLPREVEIAGLDHRARRRYGIPAALDFNGVEIRPVGHMLGGVAFTFDEIAGRELDEPIRAGPHRFQVCRRLA